MKKNIRDLLADAAEISKNMGWNVYEVGAYIKNDKINFYVGYVGQGLDANVYNKAYDDIVYLAEYYEDFASGEISLEDAVELSVAVVLDCLS